MHDDIAARTNTLWATHFEAQERRVAAQEQALVALLAGSLDDAARRAAASEAHKLAGSLGTFGLDEGSRWAADAEEAWLLQTQASPDLPALATAVVSLRKLLRERKPQALAQHEPSGSAASELLDILLVDDDEVFANYVLDPLKRRYRVSWMSSGESALASVGANEQYPKVMLLDIEMPGMDGLTLLEQLAQDGALDHTAIVMLTRRTLAEDIVRARRLGVFDFLAKPISISTLTERVARAYETVH